MCPSLVIDSDTHIGEPADLWTSRFPIQEWGDDVPHVRWNEAKQRQEWYVGGQMVMLAPAGAAAGWDQPVPSFPPTFEDANPAIFDVEQRLGVMDEQGIWAQVVFPNVGGFGNGGFLKIGDERLRNACVRAYNDYVVEWREPASDRFVAVCATPFWDVGECTREIQRAYEIGHRAVLFTGKPDQWWGEPHLGDPHWEPLWSAAEELGIPMAFHAGGADPSMDWGRWGYKGLPTRTRLTANSVPSFLGNAQTVVDLIFSGVLARHPNLDFVIVESGVGWLGFVLECADYQFKEHRLWEVSPELELLPSEYFKRQVYASFWFEKSGPRLLSDVIGADNIMFETDFPHPTCLWPSSEVRRQIAETAEAMPDDLAERVFWKTAARLYDIPVPEVAPAG